jgi:hypothetical protein
MNFQKLIDGCVHDAKYVEGSEERRLVMTLSLHMLLSA